MRPLVAGMTLRVQLAAQADKVETREHRVLDGFARDRRSKAGPCSLTHRILKQSPWVALLRARRSGVSGGKA
jgi:hypothetical protein